MARVRKLFPIYGSALANNILAAIERDRFVGGFVTAYVNEYDRRGILGGPDRERELTETIGREILLSTVLEVRTQLPLFFGKKSLSKLNGEEKQQADAFFRELMAALERAQHWTGEDRRLFRRDLGFYSGFDARRESASPGKRGKIQEEESPFIARVAVLLDPSMLEQSRRAARKFYPAARQLARKLLRQTLHAGRA